MAIIQLRVAEAMGTASIGNVLVEVLRDADVLLQAVVVEIGDKTPDGNVIDAVAPAWFEIVRLLKSDPEILFKIPWRTMEEMIAAAYKADGYEVILTPPSGDRGRDVIAVKNGRWSVRIIDQVKAYRKGLLVPANDVRALLGVLTADQNTSKGVITTTSDFAPLVKEDPLIKPFLPYRLELVNGEELTKRLIELTDAKEHR